MSAGGFGGGISGDEWSGEGVPALRPPTFPSLPPQVFETANRYHLLHSLVLLSVPRCRRPGVAGALLSAGMSLFCGPFYYFAVTGDPSLNRAAPVGGTLLILGWAAMAL